MNRRGRYGKSLLAGLSALFLSVPHAGQATNFTTTVPGTGVQLPAEYPEAGGVAIVMTGANGNIYYQYSDPDGAFVGFQNRGNPRAFRGNPFTINDPIALDCGFRSCTDYFGGAVARIDIRFSAYDGDTQVGGFDQNDINLVLNGFDVGSWSGLTTEITNNSGTTSFGFADGFGNNTFNTGWFSSTNPALLANILATNTTTTQVFDADPNDNYWDFTRGPSLPSEELRTIAPGYEFEKSVRGGATAFLQVGDTFTYDYVVRNIGSVDINNITVVDDKIPNVTCPASNSLASVPVGTPTPNELVCEGTYTVTQADVDAGEVINIARANGTPEFGQLGEVEDSVRLEGPAFNDAVELEKVGSPDPFGNAGSPVTYDFTIRNTGNTTLRNVVVTDPRLPGLSCTVAELLPLSADNTDNTETCQATYTVLQDDVDAFVNSGTQLTNTASVAADGSAGTVNDSATDALAGPVAAPALTIDKTALTSTFDAVGDLLDYRITVTNDGNVTWPGAPTITDVLTGGASCPAGSVAPGASVICTASYSVDQDDLDAGSVENTAEASVTVGGVTVSGTDSATVDATLLPALRVVKTLSAGPDPFTAVDQVLVYEYEVFNDGNVVVNSPTITDDRVTATCTDATIPPGGSVICTSDDYLVTQTDLNTGSVTNTASASADVPGGGTVTSPDTDLTVQADQSPELTLTKGAETIAAIDFIPGNFVEYSYTVVNTGNVDLPGPIEVTDDQITGTIPCQAGPLAPTEQVICTADYEIQATDITRGFVTNTAFATAGDTTRSNSDSQTVPQAGSPALSLEKTATTASFATVGDQIDFEFLVTNSGDVALGEAAGREITVTDTNPAVTVNACAPPGGILLPGASFLCTGSYLATQDDLDAGEFANTASVSFELPDGTVITSAPSTAIVPSTAAPDFTVSKSSSDQITALNQTISYTIEVTNSGVVTLDSVDVSDSLVPGYTCRLSSIAPGATAACPTPVEYTVTQPDIDRGFVDNTATAEGTAADGTALTRTDDARVEAAPGALTRSLAFTKTAVPTTFAGPGETITYTLAVENDGDITLTNVVVEDTDLGLTCTLPTLAPGTTDTSCTGSRLTTQEDFDAGSLVNNATAAADSVTPVPDTATVNATGRSASFALTKSADMAAFAAVGDRIRFTLEIENTGNVSINALTLTDALFDPDLTCTIPTLAPGATDTSCFATFVVEQADIDAGSVTNDASATGTGADGTFLTDDADITVPGPTRSPALSVTKVERDGSGTFANGAAETYDFTVTNTGNVTLAAGGTLNDADAGFTCTLPELAPGASTALCQDGTTPLEASLTPDQDDVDAGSLTNTVDVSMTAVGGGAATGSATVILNGPTQVPNLSLAKASDPVLTSFAAVGDTINYAYTVTNTGNVTITQPVTIADDRVMVTCLPLPAGGLVPGGTLACTASDTVDQADLDAGAVINVATANVTQGVVPSTQFPNGLAVIESAPASVTVNAVQTPALDLIKRVKAGTPSTFDGPGDLADASNPNNITFEFEVTNTGNVTTTAPIEINDTTIPISFACAAAGVAPGETVLCETQWAPEQGDVNSGSFTNTASASTQFNGAPVPSNTDTATVTAIRRPELEATKSLVSISNGNFAAGETITYAFTVRNIGNTTVFGPIEVADNRIGTIPCQAADLLPGEAANCTGEYVITTDDVDRFGSVTNVAEGQGTSPLGPVTSEPVSFTVPTDANPSLQIEKAVDPAGTEITSAPQTLDYVFTITNNSTGTFPPSFNDNIEVTDSRIGTFSCPLVGVGPTLDAGESFECRASDVATQADLDAVSAGQMTGFVTNSAVAETIFAGNPVPSNAAVVTVPGAANDVLTVEKLATPQTPAPVSAGDLIDYSIVARNDGNRTLSNVVVTDARLPGLSCDVPAPLTLAPTEFTTCTGTYTVTQDDIDAQDLTNTANAEGAAPDGTLVSGTDDATVPVDAETPGLEVIKTIAGGGAGPDFTDPGQIITFTISVENTGNVTLDGIEVTDSIVPGTCVIGTLVPDQIDTATCSFEYEVQQEDIDRGTIDNTATATGTARTPAATPVEDDDTATATGPDREPRLDIAKNGTGPLADGRFDTEGQTLSYEYTLINLGNVTLNGPVTVIDDVIGTIECSAVFPAGGLAPSQEVICPATYDVTQTDVDNGGVTNVVDASVPDPTNPANPAIEATDTLTIDAVRSPSFTVDKTADMEADVMAGDEITYSYLVTNTGNVTLTDILLEDQHTTTNGTTTLDIDDDGEIASLAPGASTTLQATYTITQDDIDAGVAITNTVTATADPPAGVPALDPETDTANVTPEAGDGLLQVRKTVRTPPAQPAAGEALIFEVTVDNIGNVTLDTLMLTDTVTRADGTTATGSTAVIFEGGDTGATPNALDVDEVWTYRVEYTLTQEDVDAGGIENTLRVDATDPQGGPVSDISDSGTGAGDAPTPVTLTPSASLEVLKTVRTGPALAPEAGDTIVFELEVQNTGQATLSAPILTETLLRADGAPVASTPTPIFESGDTGLTPNSLDVTETWIYRVEYTLTQEDIDAGGLTNSVLATADPPIGPAVSDTSDDGTGGPGGSTPTSVPLNNDPAMEVVKALVGAVPARPVEDDVLTFQITIENTGNVTLGAPTLSDDLILDGSGAPISPAPFPVFQSGDVDGDTQLDVDEIWVYDVEVSLTQDMIDAGGFTNQVDATATTPGGGTVDDRSDPTGAGDAPTPVVLPADPGIEGLKTITNSPEIADDIVRFEIRITNTGNVTLTSVSIPSDTLTRADGTPLGLTSGPDFVTNDDGSPIGSLRPGETATYRATYTLTQPDIDAGGIANQALVQGNPPTGPAEQDQTGNGTPGGEDAPTTLDIPPNPALELVKRLQSGGPSVSSDDDVLVYAFDVTNTGNVTAGTVSITDQRLIDAGVTPNCPATLLAPGESLTCTATYNVTQEDMDAVPPLLSNTATASDGVATSDPSTVDVVVLRDPSLVVDKQAVSVTFGGTTFGPGVPPEQFRVGAIITYEFTVTNDGNVSFFDPITVDDNLIDVICPPLPGTGLPPEGETICTGQHEVIADDVDLGSVTNLATASSEGTSSPPVSATVPNNGTPALSITKTLVSGARFAAVGDELVYSFEVVNSGQVSFVRDVVVQDPLLGADTVCFAATAADPDFAPGETVTCGGTYSVTQDDIDRGEVDNAANAQTTFGTSNREVVSPPSDVTTLADEMPGLALEKTVTTLPVTAVGQVLTYTLRAENTGNQTLDLVSVTDPLLPDLVCEAPSLAPGGVLTCSDSYTVDQDDFDRGTLVNTADAQAVDPSGDAITASDGLTTAMPAAVTGLTLAKTAQPEPFGPDGSTIEFRFRVENTGNVTLTDVTVTDPLVDPPFECVVPELLPGVPDTDSCIFLYTVTQDDVDAGSVLNTASATGTPARGDTPTASDTISVNGAAAEPSLAAEKRSTLVGDGGLGSVVEYELEVINTGNVTLAVTGITDTMTRLDGSATALDAAFAFVGGDDNGDGRLGLRETWLYTASYTITQDDIDAGGFENTAQVDGTAPDGTPVSDLSDDGDDADGNTQDDPTTIFLAQDPGLDLVKSIETPGAVAGDVVTYELVVTNTGNVTLRDLFLTDTMTDLSGAQVTPEAPPALVGPPAGAFSIGPGETLTYQLNYELTQSDIDAGGLSNTATVSSRGGPPALNISDISDSGDPAAGAGLSDPTILRIEAEPSATLEKSAGTPVRAGGTLYDIPFTLVVENTGNVTLADLSLIDDLAAFASPAQVVSVTDLQGSGFGTGGVDQAYNGVSRTELLAAGTALVPGEVGTITFTVRLDAANGSPTQPNQAIFNADRLEAEVTASVRIEPLLPPSLVVTKSVTPGEALLGATVTYTIQVENTGEFDEVGLTVVDQLPAGLVYTPDTARVDGTLSEPQVAGREQRWTGLSVAAGEVLTVTLQVRVTEGPGAFENRAFALDAFGEVISNIATATLIVRPEAVFDCGDVIGRVFDDVDLDGYYDGPDPRTGEITDQAYAAGDKFGVAPAEDRVEQGLPRVRLATVNGTIITTDEFGRFNVPCAALPRDIGSNFTLKLDTTSLPTGYHVTTENPRTIRLTPGRLAKMNFGAALADVIDIALTAEAFAGNAPSDALVDGLKAALPQLAEAPVILRLSYRDTGEGSGAARARLDAVEALIRDNWPRGRTRPAIERTVVGGN